MKTKALSSELRQRLPELLDPLRVQAVRADAAAGTLEATVRSPGGAMRRLAIDFRLANTPGRLLPLLQGGAGQGRVLPVIAATFLSERARQLCRAARVGYLDLAGNCFLPLRDFHLERSVERNPHPARGRPAELFSPASSRALHRMLEEPARAWQVSELSREAGISLGHASNLCRRLLDEGYAQRADRRLRLTQPGPLLDAWRDAAKPPQPAGLYYSFDAPGRLLERIAEAAATRRWRYAVTSFAAAGLVAPFVQGNQTVQWYIGEESTAGEWAAALDLRPASAGPNAMILVPHDDAMLSRTQQVHGLRLASMVRLYLDLWQEPARGREQAEHLRTSLLPY
jgi:hypothetical protein